MKKLFTIILSCLLITAFVQPVFAISTDSQIEYFDDGSYIVTAIDADNSGISFFSTTTTKSKSSTYYTKSGTAVWAVKVTGTFTYGNGTSKCTSSSVNTSIYNGSWKTYKKSSSYSGNRATATVTMKKYVNDNVIQTINRSVTLTCSSTGKFS